MASAAENLPAVMKSTSIDLQVSEASATLQRLREMQLESSRRDSASSGGSHGATAGSSIQDNGSVMGAAQPIASGAYSTAERTAMPGSGQVRTRVVPVAAMPAQSSPLEAPPIADMPAGELIAEPGPVKMPPAEVLAAAPPAQPTQGVSAATGVPVASEPAAILSTDKVAVGAGNETGDAGFPEPPRASSGISGGIGLSGGKSSSTVNEDLDTEFHDSQEEQPGIGSQIMSALGYGGGADSGTGAPPAGIAGASGGTDADAPGITSRIMTAVGLGGVGGGGGDAIKDAAPAAAGEMGSGHDVSVAAGAGVAGTAGGSSTAGPGPATGGSQASRSQNGDDGGAAQGGDSGDGAAQGGGSGSKSTAGDDYEWVADLLAKMWPYTAAAVTKEANVQLPPLIEASKPTWMGSVKLHKFELGGAPPKLTDIRVIKDDGAKGLKGDEYIHLEVDFDWNSSQDVEMDVSPISEKISYLPSFVTKPLSKATEFRCGVENFEMFGQLMISFRPIMHQLPVIGAVQVCFVEPPEFDFDVTLGAGNSKLLDLVPSLKSWLYGFISDTLLAAYVLPDHYFYPMDPAAPDYQIPVGYVEAEIVEAKNVPKMDYFKGSDVYVEIATHKRGSKQTKVADSSRHPRWNKTFKLPINVPRYQHVTAIMWDEDVGGDDEIGRAVYSVRDLKPNQTEDLWLPIKPLMTHDKNDEKDEGADRVKAKKHRFRKMLAKPMGPPDPEHKGTVLHLRLTYKELTEQQIRSVMEAEQKKQPIEDPFLKELLEEDAPAGAMAGRDKQGAQNPAQRDTPAEPAGKATGEKGATGSRAGAAGGTSLDTDAQGVEMIRERARPASANPDVARSGEVEASD